MNRLFRLFALSIFLVLFSISSNAANFFLVITMDDSLVKKLLVNESANVKSYHAPRHLTLMWLTGINYRDKSFQDLAASLKKIASDYLAKNRIETIGFANVNSFPAGGIYLEPSPVAKQRLQGLYKQLRDEIAKRGFNANIDSHSKVFTPHSTLLEAAQANRIFPTRASRAAFFDRITKRFKEIAVTPRGRMTTYKILPLRIKAVTSW